MPRPTAVPTALLLLAALVVPGCGKAAQTMSAVPTGATKAQAYMPPDAHCGGSGSGGFHGGGGMPHIQAIGPVGPGNGGSGGYHPYPGPGATPTPSPCRAR